MQDRIRTENQLLAAQQLVIALKRQLRLADEKLTTVEELIGDLRTRMCMCGLLVHPPRQPYKSIPPIGTKDPISTKDTVSNPPSCKSQGGNPPDDSQLMYYLAAQPVELANEV